MTAPCENLNTLSKLKQALTAGARHGSRHLLRSNIDWSQDILYLRVWLTDHPEVQLDGLDCFGNCPPTLAGIPDTPFPPPSGEYAAKLNSIDETNEYGPQPGWYALSVNRVFDHSYQYHYFQQFQPVDAVGYSIFSYNISPEQANAVRRKFSMPEFEASVHSD